uniref:Proline-rich receptor-like protein kinase PERK9 n=1 Tax=Callorhinus ursinus TaxID=34884 RepID=A0A3Q7Q6H1_CALUR|nr:proline-rich receptor-like protein kinase PERK9 [Callorhinus ursinus]
MHRATREYCYEVANHPRKTHLLELDPHHRPEGPTRRAPPPQAAGVARGSPGGTSDRTGAPGTPSPASPGSGPARPCRPAQPSPQPPPALASGRRPAASPRVEGPQPSPHPAARPHRHPDQRSPRAPRPTTRRRMVLPAAPTPPSPPRLKVRQECPDPPPHS